MRLFHFKRGLFSLPAILSLSALLFSCGGGESGNPGDTVVLPPAGPLVVSPASVTLHAGDNQQFSATLQGAAAGKVTWSLAEEAAGGSIDTETGAYKAPNKAGTYHVVATSASNSTLTASAIVTVTPPAGSIDLAFGKNGKVTTPPGKGSDDTADGIAIQPDGKIIIAGSTFNGENNDFLLARFNTDGTPDTNFGTGGKVLIDFGDDDIAAAVAIDLTGKIVVAGDAKKNGNRDFGLVRYDPATKSIDFKVTTPVARSGGVGALAIRSDGSILVAGGKDSSSNNVIDEDFVMVLYDHSGQLVSTFGNGGQVTTAISTRNDTLIAMSLLDDGGVVLAGGTMNEGTVNEDGDLDFALARYDSTGHLVPGFGAGGIKISQIRPGSDDFIRGIAIQNGKIVVAGFTSDAAGEDVALARYDLNGDLDPTFGTGGVVITQIGTGANFARALQIQSDGKIVIAGGVFNSENLDFVLARYEPNGGLDPTFSTDGVVATHFTGNDFAHVLAIQNDGKIIAVGTSLDAPYLDIALARYDSDGTLDPTFKTDGKQTFNPENASGAIHSLAIQPDGKIIAAGESFTGRGIEYRLIRYGTDGQVDPTFGKEGQVMAFFSAGTGGKIALRPDGKIFTAGTFFDSANGNHDFVVGLFNPDGTSQNVDIAGFGGSAGANNDFLSAVALQADGSLLVAGSTISPSGGNYDFALARFDANGNADLSFGAITSFGNGAASATSEDFANAMALQPDGKIIVVGSSKADPNAVTTFAVARFNSDGTLDLPFGTPPPPDPLPNPPPPPPVGTGRVLTKIGTGHAVATSIVVQDNEKILVGGYTYTVENGRATNFNFVLARYNPNGRPDITFGVGAEKAEGNGQVIFSIDIGNEAIYDMAVQEDGKIVVAGFSNVVNADFAVARFNPNGTFDTTFGNSGARIFPIGQQTDFANTILIQPDGKIIAGGGTLNGTHYEFALARFWP